MNIYDVPHDVPEPELFCNLIMQGIRTVDRRQVTSGAPSCISCSRDMLEAGVAVVWLWHDTGWRGYAADEFHALSLQHEKHRLPVIRL